MKYIAIDPGITTGIAGIILPSDWRKHWSAHEAVREGWHHPRPGFSLRFAEITGPEFDQVSEIMNWILSKEAAHLVVIEQFRLRERTMETNLLAPVRLTARLYDRLEFGGYDIQTVEKSPSSAKSIVTDDRLKRWGIYYKKSPHIRDAIRHLLLGMRDE